MTIKIHPSWYTVLQDQFDLPYWRELTEFVRTEYTKTPCHPAPKDIFRAFDLTPFDQVRVVILGQDPYHTPGAATGLSFSTPTGSKPQPSLRNIFQELESDIGVRRTQTDLSDWASQGILLINSVLTVRSGLAASHAGKGWETFTDSIIQRLSEQREGLIFILWGKYAISKGVSIDQSKHLIISSAHPSPFSAHTGFFGSHPFSQVNQYLSNKKSAEVKWGEEAIVSHDGL